MAEKTRADFLNSLHYRELPYVFPDDSGVWHGAEFLFPGDTTGKLASALPETARVCQGCWLCYHSKPGDHE